MSDVSAKIFNLDQLPFESFDMAAKMRDLLIKESVHQYQIDLFDVGNESAGFVINRIQKEPHLSRDREQNAGDNVEKQTDQQVSLSSQTSDINKIYHPALRTYLLYVPLIIVGLILVLFAVEIWHFVLLVSSVEELPVWVDGSLLINITQLAGSALVIWLLSGVLINFYGTALVIDSHGLTFKQGILTRDLIHIRYADIRTIGLRQGILDRLLNIGILEFTSSGTDEVDIRFFNIANPSGVKADIEDIIEQRHVQ